MSENTMPPFLQGQWYFEDEQYNSHGSITLKGFIPLQQKLSTKYDRDGCTVHKPFNHCCS